ncbi:MAG: helix-turn-helix domain-containing protein [Candidatus Aminicenantaceae bacterium]
MAKSDNLRSSKLNTTEENEIKNIEELDFYELLNIKTDASQEEIEKAYLLGITPLNSDPLTTNSLLSQEERRIALARIEKAYQTLINPERRRQYDLKLLKKKYKKHQKVYFRKSTEKVEIEDAEEEKNRVRNALKILLSHLKRKKKREPDEIIKLKDGKLIFLDSEILYSGEYLKRIRERQGLSLEEVAKATKFRISLLEALEEENYEKLPQGVYVINIIKIYARYLGLKP